MSSPTYDDEDVHIARQMEEEDEEHDVLDLTSSVHSSSQQQPSQQQHQHEQQQQQHEQYQQLQQQQQLPSPQPIELESISQVPSPAPEPSIPSRSTSQQSQSQSQHDVDDSDPSSLTAQQISYLNDVLSHMATLKNPTMRLNHLKEIWINSDPFFFSTLSVYSLPPPHSILQRLYLWCVACLAQNPPNQPLLIHILQTISRIVTYTDDPSDWCPAKLTDLIRTMCSNQDPTISTLATFLHDRLFRVSHLPSTAGTVAHVKPVSKPMYIPPSQPQSQIKPPIRSQPQPERRSPPSTTVSISSDGSTLSVISPPPTSAPAPAPAPTSTSTSLSSSQPSSASSTPTSSRRVLKSRSRPAYVPP